MGKQRRILITGASGFIGANLRTRLDERADTEVLLFVRGDSPEALATLVANSDAIVHLAGSNRPADIADFDQVNAGLTHILCNAISATGRNIPLIFASSKQAETDSFYGLSKFTAEKIIQDLAVESKNDVAIYRLPGVFGKWCKPNYNSVVATFCHNIARGLPIQISDGQVILELVYIDDVIDEFLRVLDGFIDHPHSLETRDLRLIQGSKGRAARSDPIEAIYGVVLPQYKISLNDLAGQIFDFQNCRTDLVLEAVGTGLTRALYSTYISYLPKENFSYDLEQYKDERGTFVEILKTPNCGQFSFFTVHPGVTRGAHYHHSKTEKFLVVSGTARMRLRHMLTGETCEITISADKPKVVDSIPGWVHDITNIGEKDAIIMIWANEIFDRNRPDCIPCNV